MKLFLKQAKEEQKGQIKAKKSFLLFITFFAPLASISASASLAPMPMATTQPPTAQQHNQTRQGAAPEERYRILVKKGERKLYLYVWEDGKERLAKTYQIALGNN